MIECSFDVPFPVVDAPFAPLPVVPLAIGLVAVGLPVPFSHLILVLLGDLIVSFCSFVAVFILIPEKTCLDWASLIS